MAKGKEGNYYFDARVGEIKTKFDRLDKSFHLDKAEYERLKAEYQAALNELGKEPRTVTLMRDYAYLLAYYGNEVQEASDLLYDVIEMPKVPNNVKNQTKLDLGDLLSEHKPSSRMPSFLIITMILSGPSRSWMC